MSAALLRYTGSAFATREDFRSHPPAASTCPSILRSRVQPSLLLSLSNARTRFSPPLHLGYRRSRPRRCPTRASQSGSSAWGQDYRGSGGGQDGPETAGGAHSPSPSENSNGSVAAGGRSSVRKQLSVWNWLSRLAPLVWLARVLRRLRKFMPGGSWWEMGGGQDEEQQRATLRRTFERMWELVAPDRLLLAMAFFFLVSSALSEVAIPHFVAATIFSAGAGQKEIFLKNANVLLGMTFAYGILSGLRGCCFNISNQRLVQRMREKLFRTLLLQDIAFFDTEAVGDLTSRLGSDCQQVARIIGGDVNIMLRNALQGVGALLYLFLLSWPLALSTALMSALLWGGIRVYGDFQQRAARVVQDTLAQANQVAEETFSLARVVRTFGTEEEEIGRYNVWTKKLGAVGVRKAVAYGFWTWGSNTLYNATQVIALFAGGALVLNGRITAEQLTKFILYAEWVVHATWWVGEHWASLLEAVGASEKVFDLMDLPPAPQLAQKHGAKLPELKGRIEFRNVGFRYPTRPTVGLSGSGKSTLLGLVQRLYDPTEGQVLVDGTPLSDLDIAWFRTQIGVVSQEPRLFSTDIASNIGYGAGGAVNQRDLEAAARQAHAEEFIGRLPEGYRSAVDNSRLSGGQKQRIAIARALVRDPKILILDEATSALDADSEHNVQLALDAAMMDESGRRKRTVLVIAHRLSTIRSANRIVVMQGGRVVEVGTHEELVKTNSEYARLNRHQFGDQAFDASSLGGITS